MTDQTSFMPLASGPQQPAYWQPPTNSVPANDGWGQPGGLWTGRPVPPAQSAPLSVPPPTLDTGGRRPPERRIRAILIVLLATMTAAAGTFGVLYVRAAGDSSVAASALTEAKADTASATAGRRKAEDARDEAEGRAATAEDERDKAKATAQGLQTCQQASRDLLVALGGDADDPAATEAATDAVRRMADSCV